MMPAHAIAALLLAAASVPALAQQARIHGEIEGFHDPVLTVKAQTGDVLNVQLAKDGTVTAMTAAKLADITKGKFVGTAAHPGGPDGALTAIEVHIFADSMRGTGEGHHPMTQGNTMTNATVESAVKDMQGRTLTLRYKGGEQKVQVPDNVPIVMLAPGKRSMLKRGEHVSFQATRHPDGVITASRVTVGIDGVVPPL